MFDYMVAENYEEVSDTELLEYITEQQREFIADLDMEMREQM